jgi:hypothetical protein
MEKKLLTAALLLAFAAEPRAEGGGAPVGDPGKAAAGEAAKGGAARGGEKRKGGEPKQEAKRANAAVPPPVGTARDDAAPKSDKPCEPVKPCPID